MKDDYDKEMDEFWEVQKLLDEFDRDLITPLSSVSPFTDQNTEFNFNNVEKAIQLKVRKMHDGPKPCYICLTRTNDETLDGFPICFDCVSVHLT